MCYVVVENDWRHYSYQSFVYKFLMFETIIGVIAILSRQTRQLFKSAAYKMAFPETLLSCIYFPVILAKIKGQQEGFTGGQVLICRADDDIMSPKGLILGVSAKLRYAQKPCADI